MLTTTTSDPAPTDAFRRTADAVWAVTCGLLGLIANALLIAFFVLAEPFSGTPSAYGWLGGVNDVFVAAQFLTLIPVVIALRRRLPRRAAVRGFSVAAVVASALVVILQVLLVARVLEFEVQIWLVMPTIVVVFGWVLGVSAIAHRHRLLDPTLTRFGLLLGFVYPIALLLTLAGYGIGSALGLGFTPVLPGLVVGGLAWLAFPLWPLLLARLELVKGRP